MTSTTNTTGAISKAAAAKATAVSTPQKTMKDLIKSMEGEISKALPSAITPERFTRMVLSAISSNPKLAECTPKSFLAAMMNAAQLGLEPNTPMGQAYLIPYKNKGVMEIQFQIGYKGLIDLAYRSDVTIIQAHEVCENDEFEYELGLDPVLKHKPALTDRGDVILYYATFKTKNGGYGFEVMSVDDIKKHASKYSQSFNSSYSPWTSNFDEMAKKTVIKKCLKYAPLKSEFAKQISTDETIKTNISEDMYAEPDEMDYIDMDDDGNIVENNTEEK